MTDENRRRPGDVCDEEDLVRERILKGQLRMYSAGKSRVKTKELFCLHGLTRVSPQGPYQEYVRKRSVVKH